MNDAPAPVPVSPPSPLARAETLGWSLLVRALLAVLAPHTALRVLDAVPHRRTLADRGSLPPEERFTRAGACLGRSIARSQYLRVRGRPHALVIGVRGGVGEFEAHAWLDPHDPPADGFVVIRWIAR